MMSRCLLTVAVSWAAGACAPQPVVPRDPPLTYRAAQPTTDMSETLERVFTAVKEIQVSVSYEVHTFSEERAPTGVEIQAGVAIGHASSVTTAADTRRATAVVLSHSDRRVVLLTAAHAVIRPDTVIEYFGAAPDDQPDPSRKIRSLSIKDSQSNWVLGLPGPHPFELLAWDEADDLALIGFRYVVYEDLDQVRPIGVPTGDPVRLRPGSFVYILGYPGGYRMVSRGIATPQGDGANSFVIDGNWNQGVSGGPVLALQSGADVLEWVGMARAASAIREERFVAPEGALDHQDPALPYEGPIFLEESLRIQYGITLSVPMTTIRDFVDEHRGGLRRLGYVVPEL